VITMRNMARATITSLFAATILFGAGCSGAGNISPSQSLSAESGTLSLPGARQNAGPQNWQIIAGANTSNESFEALDFFNDTITIDEGDSITWSVGGAAHTVTFFGHLKKPRFPVVAPFGGSTYDGTVYTSSGIVFPGVTYTLTFPKAGTYPFACLFHGPEMTGVVTVNPKGTPYPHPQAYYTHLGLISQRQDLAAAFGALAEFPYADGGTTLAAGISPGLSQIGPTDSTVYRFLDRHRIGGTVSIPLGTTLTWFNQSNNEPHTITFPILGQPLPGWLVPGAPRFGGKTYDGTHITHSGILFPGQDYSLTFTAKGTYTYYCLFHDFDGMIGTVIVQ
jgi:plastocyanin